MLNGNTNIWEKLLKPAPQIRTVLLIPDDTVQQTWAKNR